MRSRRKKSKRKWGRNISVESERFWKLAKLSGENVIKGTNTCAISLLRYSAVFLDWTKLELKQLDRTRKLLTMHKGKHPKSNVDRLYISRKEGGRGSLNVEDTVHLAIIGLLKYVGNNEER